jgi:hypothetical protein
MGKGKAKPTVIDDVKPRKKKPKLPKEILELID